ncbi:hypothetical protein DOTSEDRAFT_139860 [Dothistroma septosporum NZE10]|uniref:Polysaccharide lyase 14 domain-containing protein n=2 Tax=Dothistroma septosporum TaxID=64363 RepID=M2XZX6_DOTSN|nr:hypothetical protein [Dothistroma septosporum]EME38639.1 hypothetical protein DOTSEDRAFT_139860 [Dothistroma septosporum NZE10]
MIDFLSDRDSIPRSFPPRLDHGSMSAAHYPCLFGTRSIDFNCPPGPWHKAKALADFGNLTSGWNESRAQICENACRITVCKNALSASGGMIARYDIAHSAEYSTSFTVRFHEDFEWCTGGKLGPGFFIDDGAAAGGSGSDGKGGSARLCWHKHKTTGEVYFQVYAYHNDQAGRYGSCFGRYPAKGSLARGQWYQVTMYVRSNTGCKTDGCLRVTVDGEELCDRDMRWTTDDRKRLVSRMEFATFRGGATDDYKSSSDSYIYYDTLKWERIA